MKPMTPWLALATLLSGTLDIVFACTWWGVQGVSPPRILQGIASGLLGAESFRGGVATAALGLALHYAIMLAMAATYFIGARRLPVLWQRPLPCGAIYGLVLYLVMNRIVVPLSLAGQGSGPLAWVVAGIGAHVLLVGIPIAWMARAWRMRSSGVELRPSVNSRAMP